MSMAEYTEGIAADGAAILKDGHTMFVQDVIKDLNRKSFLEQNKLDLEDRIKRTETTLQKYAKYATRGSMIRDIRLIGGDT